MFYTNKISQNTSKIEEDMDEYELNNPSTPQIESNHKISIEKEQREHKSSGEKEKAEKEEVKQEIEQKGKNIFFFLIF